MKRRMLWLLLLLKSRLHHFSFWFVSGIVLLILWMMSEVSIPGGTNWKVMLWNEDGAGGQVLVQQLLEQDSAYHFQEASGREALIEAVETGEAECGFIILQGYSEQLEARKAKKLIVYVNSSFTTKGAGAKETVFAVIYQTLAGELLTDQSETIYGSSDKALKTSLLEKYSRYLNSDEVFRVEYHVIENHGGLAEAVTDASTQRQPVRAMAMILIFLEILLSGGTQREASRRGPVLALSMGEAFWWEWLSNLASASLPAAVCFLAVRFFEPAKISLGREIGCCILLLVLADFWAMLFGRLFHSRTSYTCWTFTILLCEMILCPIFWNPGAYLPALSVAGCIFPPGLVLLLSG